MVRGILAGFLAGVSLTLGVIWAMQPNCPTEDSCKPDYQSHWFGDFWTGKPKVP